MLLNRTDGLVPLLFPSLNVYSLAKGPTKISIPRSDFIIANEGDLLKQQLNGWFSIHYVKTKINVFANKSGIYVNGAYIR